MNRKYLVSSIVFSVIVPFSYYLIDFSVFNEVSGEVINTQFITNLYNGNNMMLGIEEEEVQYLSMNWTFQDLMIVFYGIVSIVFALKTTQSLVSLFLLVRNNTHLIVDNRQLILLENDLPTFTFYKYIFINKKDWKRKNEDITQIIKHELVHVENHHSVDILILEIMMIFLWFNPFMYLYKRSIKQMHEFHADFEASGVSDSTTYAKLLVNLAANQHSFSLVSNFSKKQLKQRIKMLNTLKSKKMTKLRYLLAIPIILSLTVVACSLAPVEAQQIEKAVEATAMNIESTMPSIFPVDQVEGVEISAGFGKMINPITKKEVFHKAIDIKAPERTAIYATADGKVLKARESDKGYGNMIMIEHTGEYKTVYAHMKDFSVDEGDEVKKGDIIGTIGNTGMSTGPHLHYEVRKGDENLNPENFINIQK